MLKSGPVASILNKVRPGSADQLHQLFSSIADEGSGQQATTSSPASTTSTDRRKGNPFPALNQ